METERYRLALFSGSDEAHLRQQIAAAGYQDGDRLTVDLQAPCRTYLVYRGQEDWCRQTDPTARLPVCRVGKPGKTLFLFPGNGIHQKNMLATLRQVSPYFEQTLGELAALAKPYTPVELLDETQENPLVNQLRVYASELAIAGFWTRLGCPPDAVIGHSMGEYAAAVCAGYLSPADGFFLLAKRDALMQETVPHALAAAETTPDRILQLGQNGGIPMEMAGYNAPEVVTVCCPGSQLHQLNQLCKEAGIRLSIINPDHGGHYSGLEQGAARLAALTAQVPFHKPLRRMLSTVCPDGSCTPAEPAYWGAHMCRPVQFQQALDMVQKETLGRVIDLGVSPVLLSMAMKNLGNLRCAWIPTVRAGRNYRRYILDAVGTAFLSGVCIPPDALDSGGSLTMKG